MKLLEQLAQQNPVVAPEIQQARDAIVAAMQKTMMAARPEQPAPGAAPGAQ